MFYRGYKIDYPKNRSIVHFVFPTCGPHKYCACKNNNDDSCKMSLRNLYMRSVCEKKNGQKNWTTQKMNENSLLFERWVNFPNRKRIFSLKEAVKICRMSVLMTTLVYIPLTPLHFSGYSKTKKNDELFQSCTLMSNHISSDRFTPKCYVWNYTNATHMHGLEWMFAW